jgi:hypothetical protein
MEVLDFCTSDLSSDAECTYGGQAGPAVHFRVRCSLRGWPKQQDYPGTPRMHAAPSPELVSPTVEFLKASQESSARESIPGVPS